MRNEETIPWLERIRDGSILEKLTSYDELPKLPNYQIKVIDTAITFNELGALPKMSHLEEKTYINPSTLGGVVINLRDLDLMLGASIPDLLSVFGIQKHLLVLPEELDRATFYEAKNYRNKKGSIMSWNKKIGHSHSNRYPRFYISLVSKDGTLPSRKAFSFLDYLK